MDIPYPAFGEPRVLPALPLPPVGTVVPGLYWRPTTPFIDELAGFLQDKSVLELFAGNGLLAGYLAQRGVSITATSMLSGIDAHERGLYHPVEAMNAPSAVARYGLTHDVLLLCWPTVTLDVLKATLQWGPDRDIVFIGEVTDYTKGHLGGCATDEFFDAITVTHIFESYRGNMLEKAMVCRLEA